jgi:hypothetical protein
MRVVEIAAIAREIRGLSRADGGKGRENTVISAIIR